MLLLVLTIFATSANDAFGQTKTKPQFLQPLSNVSVAVGREAILECTLENLGNFQVAWLRSDPDTGTLLSVHTNIIVKDHRLRVTHNNYRQWYLHIKDVKETDRGFYMCQINTEPMISQTGFLDVLVPPSLIEEETSSDLIVDERNKVSLRCRARGYPTPNITWRREDGRELNLGSYGGKRHAVSKFEGEHLNISQVLREDMGAYLCIASNGVPPSLSKRISLQVNFRPKIRVPHQLVGASRGSDVQLECRVEASPQPLTSWIRQDQVILLPTHKYQISEESNSYKTRMLLKIKDLEEKDFGAYKCVAKNAPGEKEGYIRVYEVPASTTTTTTTTTTTQSVPVKSTTTMSAYMTAKKLFTGISTLHSNKNINRDQMLGPDMREIAQKRDSPTETNIKKTPKANTIQTTVSSESKSSSPTSNCPPASRMNLCFAFLLPLWSLLILKDLITRPTSMFSNIILSPCSSSSSSSPSFSSSSSSSSPSSRIEKRLGDRKRMEMGKGKVVGDEE